MKARLHEEAEYELAEASRWYEDKSEGLGSQFLAAILNGIAQIQRDPERYQRVDGEVRVFRLSRFPYKILYSIDSTPTLIVLCVMHHKRRPDYWSERIQES